MPSVHQPKTDTITLLLEELETLSAQAHTLALDLKRAQADVGGDAKQIQERFRTKIRELITNLSEKEVACSYTVMQNAASIKQRQDFFSHLAEREELIRNRPIPPRSREAELIDRREELTTEPPLDRAATESVGWGPSKILSRLALLQAEIANKEHTLHRRQAAAHAVAEGSRVGLLGRQQLPGSERESLDPSTGERRGAERDFHDLHERVAHLERLKKELLNQKERELETLRKKSRATIAVLQAEITHKNVLLSQSRQALTRLERELKDAESRQSSGAEKKALPAGHSTFPKDQDSPGGGSEGSAQSERKVQSFNHSLSSFDRTEIELRSRNRELQGKLAAQESIIERLEERLENRLRQLKAEARKTYAERAANEPAAAERQPQPEEKQLFSENCGRQTEESKEWPTSTQQPQAQPTSAHDAAHPPRMASVPYLEGGHRTADKALGLGGGRRWDIGIIKRRWKPALATRRCLNRSSDFAYGL